MRELGEMRAKREGSGGFVLKENSFRNNTQRGHRRKANIKITGWLLIDFLE